MTDFKTARTNMVDCQIHTAGVVSEAILKTFAETPRERFAPDAVKSVAYGDEDLPLGGGRFLLAPAVHARMVNAVAPAEGDKILDIGGGGYSAAVLSPLVKTTIIALEQDAALLKNEKAAWAALNLKNIESSEGKLAAGVPAKGPYDLIIVNGAVAEIPAQLAHQLSPNGRMICIVKKAGALMGQATLVRKTGDKDFASHAVFDAAAPYLPGFEPQPAFQF